MQQKLNTGYIYILTDPRTGHVKYVGQTVNVPKRYQLHLYHSKNGKARTHKEKWINQLLAEDKKPELAVIWDGSISELDQKETEFIYLFKSLGAKLTNATLGGTTTRGRKCSEETKRKLSEIHKGRCLRPPISDAEKLANSIRYKGRRLTQEIKDKISVAHMGKTSFIITPEARLKAVIGAKKSCSKPVIAIKDGVETEYYSQIEAERETSVDRKTMRGVLSGMYKQSKGFTFKYA